MSVWIEQIDAQKDCKIRKESGIGFHWQKKDWAGSAAASASTISQLQKLVNAEIPIGAEPIAPDWEKFPEILGRGS
ncbi:hypothetical protein [Achromobacter sp.]|uniref:hypothetical protein n=1 Tax=Achromobacter sp. TaxID=134375 RepID=UPI003C76DB0D